MSGSFDSASVDTIDGFDAPEVIAAPRATRRRVLTCASVALGCAFVVCKGGESRNSVIIDCCAALPGNVTFDAVSLGIIGLVFFSWQFLQECEIADDDILMSLWREATRKRRRSTAAGACVYRAVHFYRIDGSALAVDAIEMDDPSIFAPVWLELLDGRLFEGRDISQLCHLHSAGTPVSAFMLTHQHCELAYHRQTDVLCSHAVEVHVSQ